MKRRNTWPMLPLLAIIPPMNEALTLEDALGKALAAHPQVVTARAEVHRAEAEVAIARLAPWRSLSWSLGVNPGMAVQQPLGAAFVTVNVADVLATGPQGEAARARFAQAQEALRVARTTVADQVAAAWWAWTDQRRSLSVREATWRSRDGVVVQVERQVGRGTSTVADLERARVDLLQSRQDLEQGQGGVQRAWVHLLGQMGVTAWLETPEASPDVR